jgi:hypothetical protein
MYVGSRRLTVFRMVHDVIVSNNSLLQYSIYYIINLQSFILYSLARRCVCV